MKKILFFLILVLATVGVIGHRYIKSQIHTNLALNSKMAAITDVFEDISKGSSEAYENVKKESRKLYRKVLRLPESFKREGEASPAIVIHLKHGGEMSGKLIKEGLDYYLVDWKGEETKVAKKKVRYVESKTQKDVSWPYKNDVAIKRTNTLVVDGKITNVTPDFVTVVYGEGGGILEMDIDRKHIDYLMFAPVCNRESEEIESSLKTLFPKMTLYKEGNIVICTDSHITSVKSYRRTIRDTYTQIYFKFFKLLKDRKPKVQNFIVIFDDVIDFAEHGQLDGVPVFSGVSGYFSSTADVLYLYNAFGERIQRILFASLSRLHKIFKDYEEMVKSKISEKYHMRLEGELQEYKETFWTYYHIYRHALAERTLSTLRHELAHEIFHNWGLHSIILSKVNVDKEKLAATKKALLDAEDPEEQKKVLKQLIGIYEGAFDEDKPDIEATQTWFQEGVATYCEPDPIGGVNEERLFTFQEMVRNNEVLPIEFLTVFKLGSFTELQHKAILNAYGQSWAFTSFLMAKYPDEFMDFQSRMAVSREKEDNERDLEWLLEALDRDLPTLEKEFAEYMATFKKIDDPRLTQYMKIREIWRD